MRILLTADPEVPVPPVHYGGLERIVFILCKFLKKRGHQIGLAAHRQSTASVDRLFPWRGRKSQKFPDILANSLTLCNAVNVFKPDVVHSNSRLLYMLPLFFSSIPKLMTYHRHPGRRQISWAATLAGKSLEFSGVSRYIEALGRTAGGQWHAIHNCIELENFEFRPHTAPDAPLVFLSRIEKIKGAHTAIQIALQARKRLLIAGNYGAGRDELRYWKSEIEPFLGREGIEYVGEVNDGKKSELLGKASAMVAPIEWDEPFGLVFAESLACGTPVISCGRGALPEIVRDGKEGFLINGVKEGVQAVFKLGQINRLDCRKRAEEMFSADVVVDQYEALYKKMVQTAIQAHE